ncbi:MAG: flagellar basal-body MS-ring/collar protein FliF [Planctomycetaceae bacterium]
MNFLKALQAQITGAWQRYNVQQRALLVFALLAGAGAIVGVGVWSGRSEYVLLANQLGPSQAGELISRLQSSGVAYKLSLSGSEVLVPKEAYAVARTAAGDLLDPLQADNEQPQGGMFDDPTLIRSREHRNQELQIARMIMRLQGIAQADVRISRPNPSPFVRSAQPTTASVVLTFKPGMLFDRQQSASLVQFVAHSVEGLRPDDITIMDNTGRTLSEKQSGLGSDVGAQFEFQQRLEADLAAKAETMLSQLLGPGRAIVRVSANIDFTQTSREEQTYDPDTKVKKSEKITTEDTMNQEASKGGAGSELNTNPSPGESASRTAQTSKTETIETEYENTKIINKVVEAPGRLQRITVSAAVNIPEPVAGGTKLAVADIEKVIKQAVGFSEIREDAIQVIESPLAGVPVLEDPVLAGPGKWQQYEGLVRNASLGVASLVVLAISLLTLRKVRPVVVSPPMVDGLSIESSRRLTAITRQAEDDPEAIAKILENWLGQDEESQSGSVRAAA